MNDPIAEAIRDNLKRAERARERGDMRSANRYQESADRWIEWTGVDPRKAA